MLNIGLIDLDTSHARSFARLMQAGGQARITAVYDGQQVRTSRQIDQFCDQLGCRRYDSCEALARSVDAAMVLSADWQVHLDRLVPLLNAGVPTYVDKPLSGSVAELDQFVALAQRTATPVLTGSGWRYNRAVEAGRQQFADAEIQFAHAIIGKDYFYYGIHAIEAVLGVLGPGLVSVSLSPSLPDGSQVMAFVHRRTHGRILIGGDTFFRGVGLEIDQVGHAVTFSGQDIHQGVCDALLAMCQHGCAPIPPQQQVESVRALLAGWQSLQTGAPVLLTDLNRQMVYPSDAFMAQYRRQAKPVSLLGSEKKAD